MSFLDEAKAREKGQRGKGAEDQVKELLQKLGNYSEFDWERIYDARSAGGRFPARPGDFSFFALRDHGLIEAKELAHEYRLPAKNFKDTQLAKLRRRERAGGVIVVLVYHTKQNVWRNVPFLWLWDNKGDPSWDLREFPTYGSLSAALCVTPFFKGWSHVLQPWAE